MSRKKPYGASDKKITVDRAIELLLDVPGGWLVRFGEKGVVHVTSPDGMRFAFLHSDGRPTYWCKRRQPPEYLVVACPFCKAPVGKLCKAPATGSSTDLHIARRRAVDALRAQEEGTEKKAS